MIISPEQYIRQPISPTLTASSLRSFQVSPTIGLSHECITSIVNLPVFALIGYPYSPNTEHGDHLYRILGSCWGQIFSGHHYRFKGRHVVADPCRANKARALLAHDYQWYHHLAENPPHLTDTRPKAVLEIADVEDSAWRGEDLPLEYARRARVLKWHSLLSQSSGCLHHLKPLEINLNAFV
jgi:hypothetical protein